MAGWVGVDTEINAKPAQAKAGVGAGAELGKNCWYLHERAKPSKYSSQQSPVKSLGFRKAPTNQPPDQVQIILETIKSLDLRVQNIEKKGVELTN